MKDALFCILVCAMIALFPPLGLFLLVGLALSK